MQIECIITVVRTAKRSGNDRLYRRQTSKVANVPPLMIVKPWRRWDELKFSVVDQRRNSDRVNLDTSLVCGCGFCQSGQGVRWWLTVCDQYCHALYVCTLALNVTIQFHSSINGEKNCVQVSQFSLVHFSYGIYVSRSQSYNKQEYGICPIAAVCTVHVVAAMFPFRNFFSGHVMMPEVAWEHACQIRSCLNL